MKLQVLIEFCFQFVKSPMRPKRCRFRTNYRSSISMVGLHSLLPFLRFANLEYPCESKKLAYQRLLDIVFSFRRPLKFCRLLRLSYFYSWLNFLRDPYVHGNVLSSFESSFS